MPSILTAVALLAVTFRRLRFAPHKPLPATLTGSVYDATGAVSAGVALTLENAQEVKQQATTDATGRFDVPTSRPGQLMLAADAAGVPAVEARNSS